MAVKHGDIVVAVITTSIGKEGDIISTVHNPMRLLLLIAIMPFSAMLSLELKHVYPLKSTKVKLM